MVFCYICSATLKLPVCLPCGHVFCSQCILTTVKTVHTPMHRCPACESWFNIAPLDTKTVPPNLRPFVTPSVRPLQVDIARSDTKTESTRSPPPSSSESSMQTSAIQSSSGSHTTAGLSDEKVSSEMARLRAENHALRTNSSMWRKRAEVHGEANLNLLKFARAMRDQASQIARDRNDLEQRCLMLKRQLDGESSYSDEMQKYGKSSQPPPQAVELDLRNQTVKGRSHHHVPSPSFSSSKLPSRTSPTRLDFDQSSRKRPRTS